MQTLLYSLANNFVNFFSLLGATWTDAEKDAKPFLKVIDPIIGILEGILPVLFILIGTAGSIYAIVLGVNYARAETADKREEAKKRMINAIVGLVVMILLLVILQLFVDNAQAIVNWIQGGGSDLEPTP